MSLGREFKLSSGYSIPAVGLGAGGMHDDLCIQVVKAALNIGYLHIDTAEKYGNETEIGNSIKESSVARDKIFVTSKVWATSMHYKDLKNACYRSLNKLQLDYLDLYLLHWPVSFASGKDYMPTDPKTGLIKLAFPQVPISETWKAMEELVAEGKVKSIGVSNFSIARLKELLDIAKIKPVVNQVEGHPQFQQRELLEFCQEHDILLTCFAPLGRNHYGEPKLTEHPTIIKIANSLNADPAVVLISWAVQRGTSVIPKTSNLKRLQSNFKDCMLSEAHMQEINKLDGKRRNIDPINWGLSIDVYGDHGGDENAYNIALERVKKEQITRI